jgi:hypothetical protein
MQHAVCMHTSELELGRPKKAKALASFWQKHHAAHHASLTWAHTRMHAGLKPVVKSWENTSVS